MKHKKPIIIIAVIVVILVFVGAFVFSKSKTKTATTYEDAGGWIYKCSRQVPVKDQGVKYGNGEPSLTPINQSDADKYCNKIGIE